VETFRATSDAIACTLSQEELRDTTSAWRKLLRTALLERAEIPGLCGDAGDDLPTRPDRLEGGAGRSTEIRVARV
jgi:hypothetical protein